MTDSIEQPRFLPWLRRGLAAHITDRAVDGMATAATAAAAVSVTAKGSGPGGSRSQAVPSPAISLAGPGDVVGFNQNEVIRRYPTPGTDDAEPDYFPHVEFSSPDLPWRYTPAAADDDDRLQPWLMLVVVPDQAPTVTLTDLQNGRLPVLHIEDRAAEHLPSIGQSWAWAHAQAEADLSPGVAAVLDDTPEHLRSRLLCPRHLEPNRPWIACVVPTFEVGRLSGLGRSEAATRLTAWTDATLGSLDLPVYLSWRFRTGQAGDFESLVRRLEARTLPGSVGRRRLDLRNPGGGLTAHHKALGLYTGALVSPMPGGDDLDPEHQKVLAGELEERINRAAVRGGAANPYHALANDPAIGPPAYAAPQVGRRSVPSDGDPPYWFRQLSTEPQRRVVAGLGAEVVRNDQEALMAVAWNHLGDGAEVNRVLGRARLAWEVGVVSKTRLETVTDDRIVQLAGPALHRCAVEEGRTLQGTIVDSDLPAGLISGPMRRLSHNVPGFTVVKQGPDDGPLVRESMTDLITAIAMDDPADLVRNWGDIKIPPGTDPGGSQDDPPTAGLPADNPAGGRPLDGQPVDDRPFGSIPGGEFPNLQPSDFDRPRRLPTQPDASMMNTDVLGPMLERLERRGPREPQRRPRARRRTKTPDTDGLRRRVPAAGAPGVWSSPAATRPLNRPVAQIGTPFVPSAQTVDTLVADVRTALDPPAVVKAMVDSRVRGLSVDPDEKVPVPVRVTAEPLFTTPMYRRLTALSVDYLVPGVGDIPDDTLGLLEVNRPFIEAFFAGLNHEMSRELLWREYPAPLNRTWFRQFWDTVADDTYDITPIDQWTGKGFLGDNRPPSTTEAGLVLLIKGALPRRYPDMRVYAVEATWKDGQRRENTDADAIVHQPLFTGNLGPGVHFYGFNLQEEDANGSTDPNRHPGYFLVLEEQVGKPRFGLDEARVNEGGTAPNRWSNLRWSHLRAAGDPVPDHVSTDRPTWLVDAGPLPGNGGRDQWGDEAAAMARITLQRPVRMLVHASAMLPDDTAPMAALTRRAAASRGPGGGS